MDVLVLFALIVHSFNSISFEYLTIFEHLTVKVLVQIHFNISSLNLIKCKVRWLEKGFWDPVIEKVARRLDGWKKAFLSLGGRITSLQSCLSHIPCYFLIPF